MASNAPPGLGEDADSLKAANEELMRKNEQLKEQMAVMKQNAELAQENARLIEENAQLKFSGGGGGGGGNSPFSNPMPGSAFGFGFGYPDPSAWAMPPFMTAKSSSSYTQSQTGSSASYDSSGYLNPWDYGGATYGRYHSSKSKGKGRGRGGGTVTPQKSSESRVRKTQTAPHSGAGVGKVTSGKMVADEAGDGCDSGEMSDFAKAARLRLRKKIVGKSEHQGPQTTAMMRNIPPEYTRSKLLDLIDTSGFKGAYDFVYIPIEFGRELSLGYAFVNLISHEEAVRFRDFFHDFKDWFVESDKICEVAWSDVIQGFEDHVERYKNSPLMHESVPDEARPAIFKNGERTPFPAPTKKIKPPMIRREKQARIAVTETETEGAAATPAETT